MPTEREILAYYAARANEYERDYANAERQSDLRYLHQVVPAYLTGRRVLEVACGTGYWTRLIAKDAAAVTAIDVSREVLAVARTQQPASRPADFVAGDAFALEAIEGVFDAAFIGLWWSLVSRRDLHRFLIGLHGKLPGGALVLVVDRRYVDGHDDPITRSDIHGNTYQRRRENGADREVLNNFLLTRDVQEIIASAGGDHIVIHELEYFWYAAYKVPISVRPSPAGGPPR